MVRQDNHDMLHRFQICIEIRVGYVEDVGAQQYQGRTYFYQSLPKQILITCNDYQNF